ncbi:hypothetical protein OU995_21420 [Roseateles sp. SL47]|nr:hypothetical protein [Roseateles sp. SL47]WAC72104.1 hypothetical protein OU995_21420 [Roseateles sp. SL47]
MGRLARIAMVPVLLVFLAVGLVVIGCICAWEILKTVGEKP